MTLRVLVDIGHPAHVHLFKHIIWKIESLGGETCITTRQKDVATKLLDAYGFDYHIVGKYTNSVDKMMSFITTNIKLLKIAAKFNPHVFLGAGSVHVAQVAKILGRLCIILEDTEGSSIQHSLYRPFASKIYCPSAFGKNLGRNQVFYEGYHEMAYLLPNYFSPDPAVLQKYGLTPEDTYFLIRLVAWGATHDMHQVGIQNLDTIVQHLKKHGKVFLSTESKSRSESQVGDSIILPQDMQTMLAYARLYVGEGATMASESASLGVPAIYVNTQSLGYINQEKEAGLVYHVKPSTKTDVEVIRIIDNILSKPPEYFKKRSEEFLDNKIDLVDFIIGQIFELLKSK